MARRRFIDHPELDLNRPEPSLGKLDSVRLTSASGQCGSIDLEERIKGVSQLRIIRQSDKVEHYIKFDEDSFTAWMSLNPEFDTEMDDLIRALPDGEWLKKPPQADFLGRGKWRITEE